MWSLCPGGRYINHLEAEYETPDEVEDVVDLLAGGGQDEGQEVADAEEGRDADQSLQCFMLS